MSAFAPPYSRNDIMAHIPARTEIGVTINQNAFATATGAASAQ